MMASFTGGVTTTCCRCKELIYLAQDRYDALVRSGNTFHCLWGHGQVFTELESEADKLRRERDRLKQDAARLKEEAAKGWARAEEYRAERDAETRRVTAAKGRITRLKNRAATGHCPCCNRVFVDLLSHMKSKHADYETQPIDLDAAEEAHA